MQMKNNAAYLCAPANNNRAYSALPSKKIERWSASEHSDHTLV